MSRPPEKDLENVIFTRVTSLNAKIHGVVTGVVVGLGLFVATLFLVLKGGEEVGPHLALLGQFFWGYSVTPIGSLVGLAYGFVSGFVLGWFVAYLYNVLLHFQNER